MINKTIGRTERKSNPFSSSASRPGYSTFTEQFEEASVIDVIVNNEHGEYASDGYNVGSIKFRFLTTNFFRPDETLNWAFPLDSNISEYPLLNEVVYVFKALNRFYYFKKFNVVNRPTSQPLFGLNEESQPVKTSSDNAVDIKMASSSPIKNNSSINTKLGQYFQENSNIFKLKHVEGDIIYEGRTGQSIRFGSSWKDGSSTGDLTKKPFQSTSTDQSPNIIIRVGPDTGANKTVDTPFGLVIEDINKDASSIWITSDQIIKLNSATSTSGIQKASTNIPTLTGNQIVINTDRFVINSKKDRIIGFSNAGINWLTLSDITMDADGNHITWTSGDRSDRVIGNWKSTIGSNVDESVTNNTTVTTGNNYSIQAGSNISLVGSKVFIGSVNSDTEPLVLGVTLQSCLEQLLDALIEDPIVLETSIPGSPSIKNPALTAALEQIKSQFITGGKDAQILSQDNFTIRTNETPADPRTISKYTEG